MTIVLYPRQDTYILDSIFYFSFPNPKRQSKSAINKILLKGPKGNTAQKHNKTVRGKITKDSKKKPVDK